MLQIIVLITAIISLVTATIGFIATLIKNLFAWKYYARQDDQDQSIIIEKKIKTYKPNDRDKK